jgi:AcrR family transcriptional regulator
VPRDSTETRARLIREAARLFARRGVYQTPLREVNLAAGQRNVSAVNYHFGDREGLLQAILLEHGEALDAERGALLAELGEGASTRDLVGVLLAPLAGRLATPEGRDYLRILPQLTGRFAAWRVPTPLTPPNLRAVLAMLEARPSGVPEAVRRERVVQAIMLMTTAMAERARAVESGRPLALDDEAFLANLADVIVGGLEAPVGPPLARRP